MNRQPSSSGRKWHQLQAGQHEDWKRLLDDQEYWRQLHEQLVLEENPWLRVLRQSHDIVNLNNGYQWRVDQRLDVFPVNARYHILGTGERGGFKKKDPIISIEQLLRRSPPFQPRSRRSSKRRRRRSRDWNQI